MKDESKKSEKSEKSVDPISCPMPKPHPTTVIKKTLHYVRDEQMPLEEARERAKKEAIDEGKFHGVSKMNYDYCCLVRDLKEEEDAKKKKE